MFPQCVHVYNDLSVILDVYPCNCTYLDNIIYLVHNNNNVCILQNTPMTYPLHQACLDGNVAEVKRLIEAKVDINEVNADDSTAIMVVCDTNQTDCLDVLIEANADLHHMDYCNTNAIIKSITNGNLSCVKKLIEAKVHIHEPINRGYAPIHYAASTRNPGPLEVLIDLNANINQPTGEHYYEPIYLALHKGEDAHVDTLIRAKANVDPNILNRRILHSTDMNDACIQLLIEAKAYVN